MNVWESMMSAMLVLTKFAQHARTNPAGDSGRGEKRRAPEEDLKAGTAPAGDIMAANGSTLAGNGNSGAHSPPEPPAKRLAVTAGGEAS